MLTITLCLSAVGRERHVISIAQDASIHDLYEMARHAFASSAVVELKHGFPPRVMLQDSTVTLETLNVVDTDRIQVVLVEQPTNTTMTNEKTSSSSSSSAAAPKRPQRAAAKAATDSFGDVIRAQDALLNEQSGSQKREPTTA
jgi:hypothetical protein